MDLLFEWSPQKALLNERKHGVSFSEAGDSFFWPAALDHDRLGAHRRWGTVCSNRIFRPGAAALGSRERCGGRTPASD